MMWNFRPARASDIASGSNMPDIESTKERCMMKKAYEDVARFVRWAVIGVFSLIVALPALTSVGSSI
jgi:hypothetical protein